MNCFKTDLKIVNLPFNVALTLLESKCDNSMNFQSMLRKQEIGYTLMSMSE